MEYLKDINLDIDKYDNCLARQQAVDLENKLSSIYITVKKMVTDLEGTEKAHEKTVWIINSYLNYLMDLQLPDMKFRDNCFKPSHGKAVLWMDLIYFLNRLSAEEMELFEILEKIKKSYA